MSNKTLICEEKARAEKEEVICLVYTSSLYGNSIESDIITGDYSGNLRLFICGKYLKIKKKAHSQSINCLKMCELFKYKTVLISSGEDSMIKLWDAKFN